MVLRVPHLDVVLPLVPGELVLVHDSLGDQLLGAGVPRLVSLFAVVPKLGLHGVGAEEHRCLRRAIDFVTEDALLHLEEEELLGDVLDELLNTSSGKNLALNLNWRGFSFLTYWADTFFSSFNQVENPVLSTYWRPKYHTSRRPIVLTTWSKSCFP